MTSIWDSVKELSGKAGTAAKIAGQKAKLRTDIALIDRTMTVRKEKFGVDLYDFVAPLSKSAHFFAANDKMTETLRGPFLTVDREVAALSNRRVKLKEQIAQNETAHAAAFPKQASNFGEQVLNAGKSAGYASKGAKLSTDLYSVESQMRGHKQEFGLVMFPIFVELEDKYEWLPTVREIRTMYDQTRQDLEKLKEIRAGKEKELANLSLGGGTSSETASFSGAPSDSTSLGGPGPEASPSANFVSALSPSPAADPFVSLRAVAPSVNDPFASAAPSAAPVVDFFDTPAPNVTPATDPFAPSAPPPTAYDPFAVFDSVATAQSTHNTNGNSMFQY